MLTKKSIYPLVLLLIIVCLAVAEDYPPSGLEEIVTEYQQALTLFKKMDFKQAVSMVTFDPQAEHDVPSVPPDKDKNQLPGLSRFLDKLGLVHRHINISDVMAKSSTRSNKARYDPGTNTIRLGITPEELLIIRKMSNRQKEERIWPVWETAFIHELTHALQHQHSDFGQFELINNDVGLAIKAAGEGEAGLAGYYYSLKEYAGRYILSGGANLGIGFESGGATVGIEFGGRTEREQKRDQVRMINSSLRKIARYMDKDWKRTRPVSGGVRSAQAASRYFWYQHYFPAIKGLSFCQAQYKRDGWDALNKLYTRPPLSTEQILHPKKYQKDFPQKISLPQLNQVLGDDWNPIYQHVMGELGVQVLFRCLLSKGRPVRIAEGWDGDAVGLLENTRTQQLLLIWFTTWDSQKNAREFLAGYQQLIPLKYKQAKPLSSTEKDKFHWQTGPEHIWLEIRKSDVLIIEGIIPELLGLLKNKLWESTTKKEIKNIDEFN